MGNSSYVFCDYGRYSLVILMIAYVFYQNKDKKERINFQKGHCFGETYSAGKILNGM